jgi:16S rRNA (guanine(966)-N(2))-methyltransferase RsmD
VTASPYRTDAHIHGIATHVALVRKRTKIKRMKKESSSASVHAAHSRSLKRHEVRIIGGQWKRTKLAVADKLGLRPTGDRVRETLFNWLGQDLTGWRCVDAFAGTGALGFEAASRGAVQVRLIERDAALVTQLCRVKEQLEADSVQVTRGDGVTFLQHTAAADLNLVFLDPPFDSVVFESALIAAALAVKVGGFVYLESPKRWDDEALSSIGLCLHRYLKAGRVHAHLLKRHTSGAAPLG